MSDLTVSFIKTDLPSLWPMLVCSCKFHRYQIYPEASPSFYKSGFIYFCYIGPIATTDTIYYKVTAPTKSQALYHFKPYPFPGDATPSRWLSSVSAPRVTFRSAILHQRLCASCRSAITD